MGRFVRCAFISGVLAIFIFSKYGFVTLAYAQNDETIQSIEIDGAQRIEPETVKSYLTLNVGDHFDAREIDKSLKALFNTGLFADVNVSRQITTLVVHVVENPIINRIAFEGNHHLETKKLEDEVQLKPRSVYTRTKVVGDVKRLLEIYRRSGRFAASIDPKIIKLDQNRVDLVFEIKEGSATGICRVAFVGNKRFGEDALKGELQTRESRWYRFLSSDDNYDPDRVAYDRELLRRFYLKNGYAEFRVMSATAELAPDHDCFYLTFTLDEGERFTFGKIDVRSAIKNLKPEELQDKIRIEEGDYYNAEELDNTVKRLTDSAGNLGYAFAEVEPQFTRHRAEKIIDVLFDLREGPKVYVEQINISGNVKTLDYVIRREFRLVEGDAFNSSRLKRSEQRLKDLNFFKKTEVTNVPGTAPDRTIIKTKVEEDSTGQLSIGAGYSTTDGILGEISVAQRNFLGRGQDVRISATVSQFRKEYDFTFTEPYLFGRDVAGTAEIFRIERNLTSNSSFSEKSSGITTAMGYNITENLRETLRYTAREDDIANIFINTSPYIQNEQANLLVSLIGQDLYYDHLDSRSEPTEGYFASEGNSIAGAGGDEHYLLSRLKAGVYYPFTPTWILSLRGESGYIFGFGNENIRVNDRFFLGSDNFRGFKIGGVGPRDGVTGDALGGNVYYAGTLETQFPVGLPAELGVSGRAFTDFGADYHVDDARIVGYPIYDSAGLRASAGIGISWKSPFGPIRVDIAEPYRRKSFDKKQLLHFSFGTKF